MLSKPSKWELDLVHYIAKFTISRFVISRFELSVLNWGYYPKLEAFLHFGQLCLDYCFNDAVNINLISSFPIHHYSS